MKLAHEELTDGPLVYFSPLARAKIPGPKLAGTVSMSSISVASIHLIAASSLDILIRVVL